jgi:hypothetical protein
MCQSCQGIMYFCKDIKSIFSISYKLSITCNLSFYIISGISYILKQQLSVCDGCFWGWGKGEVDVLGGGGGRGQDLSTRAEGLRQSDRLAG